MKDDHLHNSQRFDLYTEIQYLECDSVKDNSSQLQQSLST